MERNTLRAWVWPCVAIALPAMAILVAIPLVRMYEYPLVSPGFDPEALKRPISAEDHETLAMYADAIRRLDAIRGHDVGAESLTINAVLAKDENKWQRAEREVVARLLTINQRPLLKEVYDHGRDSTAVANLGELDPVLDESARRCLAEGHLDAAFERYVALERLSLNRRWRGGWGGGGNDANDEDETTICRRLIEWSAKPGQTSQRLLAALGTMERLWRHPLPICVDVKNAYLYVDDFRFLRGEAPAESKFIPAYIRWAPWERARGVRLMNIACAEECARIATAEDALARGGFVREPAKTTVPRSLRFDYTYWFAARYFTPVLDLDGPYVPDEWRLRSMCAREAYRRAARFILALEAWKLDHGKLPDSPGELLGKYLQELPKSPYNGYPFGYLAKGSARYINWNRYNWASQTLAPGKPCIGFTQWNYSYNFDETPEVNFLAEKQVASSAQDETVGVATGAAPRNPATRRLDGVVIFPIP